MSTMYEFNARDALVLSSLSYFDVLDFNEPKPLYEFVNELLISPKYMDQQRTDLYTLKFTPLKATGLVRPLASR